MLWKNCFHNKRRVFSPLLCFSAKLHVSQNQSPRFHFPLLLGHFYDVICHSITWVCTVWLGWLIQKQDNHFYTLLILLLQYTNSWLRPSAQLYIFWREKVLTVTNHDCKRPVFCPYYRWLLIYSFGCLSAAKSFAFFVVISPSSQIEPYFSCSRITNALSRPLLFCP